MNHINTIAGRIYLVLAIGLGSRAQRRNERGDVPGWVLITLMTAALALVIWTVASDRLESLFTETFDDFGFGG